MIYLDNGATTFPKPECVYEKMDRYSRTMAVNVGRGSYRAAREAGIMVKNLKRHLLSLCNARGQAEVILTPSATIAINQIIQGISWKRGDTAYVSPYEHNAVLRALQLMKNKKHIQIVELPLKKDLSIDLRQTEAMFKKTPPTFVSVTAVSNVTGYILPFEEILGFAKSYGAFTMLDASQAVGLVDIYFAQTKADALVFAGHKTLYGPFGIAGFLLKNGTTLEEVIVGGTGMQSLSLEMPPHAPEKYESGSINSVAVAGLSAALEWLDEQEALETEQELVEYLLPKLREIPGIVLYISPDPKRQNGIISFNIRGFKANEVAAILDYEKDIALRAGHHCSALIHRHLNNEEFDGTVRISVSVFTKTEELDVLIEQLRKIKPEKRKQIPEDILRGNC